MRIHGLARSFLTACLLLGSSAQAETLSIRADEWYPLNTQPGSAQPGFMIEVAQALLAPHGISVDYQLMAWDEAIATVREGAADCVVGALPSDVEGFFLPQRPWVLSEQSLYARVDRQINYGGLDSLKYLRMAVIAGYSYGETLDAYINAHRRQRDRIYLVPESARASREMITRLLVGHADVMLETSVVMDATLQRDGLSKNIRKLAPAVPGAAKETLYIACSPVGERGGRFVRLFDEGMPDLERSGRLAELKDRYGIE